MNKIISLLIAFSFTAISVYDFTINDIDGNPIQLDQFKGKKILFVNTASKSRYTAQYDSLETLYQKYKDSLVIIAVPSNSFGNETDDNDEIKQFINSTYNTHFIIAEKTEVSGDNQSPLYGWLTQIKQNGMMDNPVHDDFYKFLVDGSGLLIGAFVSSVDPMSDEVQNAITGQ